MAGSIVLGPPLVAGDVGRFENRKHKMLIIRRIEQGNTDFAIIDCVSEASTRPSLIQSQSQLLRLKYVMAIPRAAFEMSTNTAGAKIVLLKKAHPPPDTVADSVRAQCPH